jgi:hypothetical protein
MSIEWQAPGSPAAAPTGVSDTPDGSEPESDGTAHTSDVAAPASELQVCRARIHELEAALARATELAARRELECPSGASQSLVELGNAYGSSTKRRPIVTRVDESPQTKSRHVSPVADSREWPGHCTRSQKDTKLHEAALKEAALNAMQRDAALAALSTMQELWGAGNEHMPSMTKLVMSEMHGKAVDTAASLQVDANSLRAQVAELRQEMISVRAQHEDQMRLLLHAVTQLSVLVCTHQRSGPSSSTSVSEATSLERSIREELQAVSRALAEASD